MSNRNKVSIPLKTSKLYKDLKEELIQDFTPIATPQYANTPVRAQLYTPTTQSLYQTIARAGYFRPKLKKDAEPPVQPLNIIPNYLRRDPREYPPIHCCPIKIRATTGNREPIEELYPKTKHVHHTLFDAGKYVGSTESPTVKSMNRTVFGRTIPTPINLIATDSFKFETAPTQERQTRQTLETEILVQGDETPLQFSVTTSMSKVPASTKELDGTTGFRRRFKGGDLRAEKFQEKFQATQTDFRKTQLRINEAANKRRSWYQEGVEEKTEMLDRMKQGGVLLQSMDSSNHRGEVRHAVRLSLVHTHYEKNWKRLKLASTEKNESEDTIKPTTCKLRKLLNDNKIEMSRIVSKTPEPIARRPERLLI